MSRAKSEKRRYTNAREQANKQSLGFVPAYLKLPKGASLFKPKTGVMLLDILPFEAGKGNPNADEGMLHWERTFSAHRGIGANSDSFLCPRLLNKKPCPVCEHRLHLVKAGDEDDEDLIKDLAPKTRQLFNVLNLKDPDKGVQIWDMSYFLFGESLYKRLRDADEGDEWENFFFLEGGLTLKIGFSERSFGGASFHEVDTIDFKPRKRDYDDDILEQVHVLDDLLVIPDYDELKETFLETTGDDDDDDEPKAKKRHSDDDDDDDDEPKAKRRSLPADDDDDDDDDDDEPKAKKRHVEEDDDDEPPKKKAARNGDDDDDDEPPKAKKKTPTDDDDDWDDVDGDDDDEPKAKKKAKDDDDDDSDDDDDEPKGKKSKSDDDDDDDDDDEPPKKKKNMFAKQKGDKGWEKDDDDDEPKAKKKVAASDDDDDDD